MHQGGNGGSGEKWFDATYISNIEQNRIIALTYPAPSRNDFDFMADLVSFMLLPTFPYHFVLRQN